MNLRWYASLVIFFGSYLPLSIILLAQDFQFELLGKPLCIPSHDADARCEIPLRNPYFSISIFAVCLFSFLFSLIALSQVKQKRSAKVVDAKYTPAELMSYTLPYVVSFMSLDYQETGKFLGIIIFLMWMFLIIHRSGQMILNPLLVVFGWRLFDVTYQQPGSTKVTLGRAICRSDLNYDDQIKYDTIQSVLVVTKREGPQGIYVDTKRT